MLQHHTKSCSADSMLGTVKECESAKAVLDPSAAAVHTDYHNRAVHGDAWGCRVKS